MDLLLAYRPFIDPLDAHEVWFLFLIPLSFLIAVGYKAVRAPDMSRYWREVGVMTVQIVVGMILLGVAAYLFLQLVLPVIAPMPA